jgi:hypothetical protein
LGSRKSPFVNLGSSSNNQEMLVFCCCCCCLQLVCFGSGMMVV